MGWHLAGFDLEYGAERRLKELLQSVPNRECRHSEGSKLDSADWEDVQNVRLAKRNAYVYDLRTQAAIDASPVPGAIPVTCVQLIQATDCYYAVQNAPVFLFDPDLISAPTTARWLHALGISDVRLIRNTPEISLQSAPVPKSSPSLRPIKASEVLENSDRFLLLDLNSSHVFIHCHAKGAHFIIRANFDEDNLRKLAHKKQVVLTGNDPALRELLAEDLKKLGVEECFTLSDSIEGWSKAGGLTEVGFDETLSKPIDVFIRPMELPEGQESAMSAYLDWEVKLIETLASDPTLHFRPERA